VRSKITFMKGSITDIEAVQKAMVQADYVITSPHALPFRVPSRIPLDTNRINVDGTLNVLVAARDNKVKRVVFAASSSAYGDTPRFRSPKTCNPCRFLLTAFRNTSANFTPRPSAGVTAWKMSACVTSTSSARARIPILPTPESSLAFPPRFWTPLHRSSFGDGEQTRDFTIVDNAVLANILACEAPAPRDAPSTSAPATPFLSTGSANAPEKPLAKLWRQNTSRLAKATSAIPSPTSACQEFLGYEPAVLSKKASNAPTPGIRLTTPRMRRPRM